LQKEKAPAGTATSDSRSRSQVTDEKTTALRALSKEGQKNADKTLMHVHLTADL
jgi:hypothetical protein